MKYQMIEDNGGGLHLVVWDHGKVRFGFHDLEWLSSEDVLSMLADLESPTTKVQDVQGWDGQIEHPTKVYVEYARDSTTRLIAHNPQGKRVTYPDSMGSAGKSAFGIEEK
jgi:hypothetical protein